MRSQEAMDEERDALARLAELIGEEENATFLAGRVRALIQQYGYSSESVLLELAQNAGRRFGASGGDTWRAVAQGRLPFGSSRAPGGRHGDPRRNALGSAGK